jgi:hypothetical protein
VMTRLASYVLPLKGAQPAVELDGYLRSIAPLVEVVVVDGSDPEVFAANHDRWSALAIAHVAVDPDLVTPMGKVGGVLTGFRRATHEIVVIADDDVRWTGEQLRCAVERMAGADVLRPQNHFSRSCWHTRWDTGRVLIARATGGDWPGTLVVRREAMLRAGGYDGGAMFENLELVRTIEACGGSEVVALDLCVARMPPTTAHFWSQRVRQAYDEWARPARLLAELAILPIAIVGRRRAILGLAAASILLAEAGRRRGGGRDVFERTAALWAPCWVAERAVTSWMAVWARMTGGVRYGSGRLRCAAHRPADLRPPTSGDHGGSEPAHRLREEARDLHLAHTGVLGDGRLAHPPEVVLLDERSVGGR